MKIFDLESTKAVATRFIERCGAPHEGATLTEAAVDEAYGEGAPRAQAARRVRYLSRTLARDRARSLVDEAEATALPRDQADTIRSLAQERILGTSDLLDINYLELAIAIGRAVARIRLDDGAATGFLVGPGLLLTNHHVLEDHADARTAVAQFDYQENSDGEPLPVVVYRFEPDRLFVTDDALDFTLVAVTAMSSDGKPITRYPWVKLISTLGKVDLKEYLNIIQHPRGGMKQIAFRNNQVITVPEGKPDFLYYTTDTDRGSSGSPCFNDQWELVALHHSGVPRTQGTTILKKDGSAYRENVDPPDSIDWIANEGARVSAIVEALRSSRLDGAAAELRDRMLDLAAPNPIELARSQNGTADREVSTTMGKAVAVSEAASSGISVVVDIAGDRIRSVHVEGRDGGYKAIPGVSTAPSAVVARPPAGDSGDGLEKVVIDPDWSSRKGYDPSFLPVNIPLPKLSAAQKTKTFTVPAQYRKGTSKYELAYHHYSVVFNTQRRIAWYSAANIDGDHRFTLPDRTDSWFLDPRVDPDPHHPTLQMGEELYSAETTDRGHLTRYLDVAWGASMAEAIRATNDTFHFTNAALELEGFNRSKSRWQGLEQFLLEQKAKKELRRMTVVTGPILKAGDPVYQNDKMSYSTRVPLQFWKVCVLVRQDGSLAATGFILGQQDITALPGFEEKFDVAASQVTIAHLEQLTGLDFGTLTDHDHFAKSGKTGALEVMLEGAKRRVKPLEDLEDIVV
jgi:endonuclease G, mitochondrial